MISEKFKKLVSSGSPTFSNIYDAISNSNKEKGKELLCLFNNLLDYFLSQEPDENNIVMPIIHIPECEVWAQELCFEFIILKLAYTKNKRKYESINRSFNGGYLIPEGCNGKKIDEYRSKIRKINKCFANNNSYGNDLSDMVVCLDCEFKKLQDVYKEIAIYNQIDGGNQGLIINTQLDSFRLENKLRKNNRFVFENLFVFSPLKGIGKSFSKNQVSRLNQYGVGIKRCFIISFSTDPFRLYQIKDKFRFRLNAVFTQFDHKDFVTFNKEEVDYVFCRNYNKKNFLIEDNNSSKIWDNTVFQFLGDRSSSIRERNICSLCINNYQRENIEKYLSTIIEDYDPKTSSDFFSMVTYTWQTKIIPELLHFVGTASSFACVCEWDTPKDILSYIISIFKEQYQKNLIPYTWSDLKVKKNTCSRNNISEQKIVIIRYRSPNSFYHNYPNSFDSIALSEGQSILEICDSMIFMDYLTFDRNRYYSSLNQLLFSNFRIEKIGWNSYEKEPIVYILPQIDDDKYNESSEYGSVEKYEIVFADKSRKRGLFPSDLVIFKMHNRIIINELKSHEFFHDVEGIQLLEDFYAPINDLIERKLNKNIEAENAIRRNPQYALSEEEIKSYTEIWKILLNHKIKSSDPTQVYKDMNLSVSFNAFTAWLNYENKMILPRDGKDQKALLTYLNLWKPNIYYKILLLKKITQKKGSEKFNNEIKNLLTCILFSDIDENDFQELKCENHEILEMLSVENIKDLQALIEILSSVINIKPYNIIRLNK